MTTLWVEIALESLGVVIAIFSFFILGLLSHAIYCAMLPQEHSPHEPSCGKCYYAISGLETWRCPECGSDLRNVGIIMPKGHGQLRTTLLVGLVAWTALCGLLPIVMWIATGPRRTTLVPAILVWVIGLLFISHRRWSNRRRIRARTLHHSPPPPTAPTPDIETAASSHGA